MISDTSYSSNTLVQYSSRYLGNPADQLDQLVRLYGQYAHTRFHGSCQKHQPMYCTRYGLCGNAYPMCCSRFTLVQYARCLKPVRKHSGSCLPCTDSERQYLMCVCVCVCVYVCGTDSAITVLVVNRHFKNQKMEWECQCMNILPHQIWSRVCTCLWDNSYNPQLHNWLLDLDRR